MTLTILILIYLFAVCLALSLLYGPLRKALDPERRRAAGTIIVSAVLGVLFMFPLIGALVPDGPVCWFFQKWGNIIAGYMIYFFGMLLVVRIIEGIVHKTLPIICVQWHPELMYKAPVSGAADYGKLFEYFALLITEYHEKK